MTFDEILKKCRDLAQRKEGKAAEIKSDYFLAVQVNVTGESSGVYYVEIKDGKVSVEPYEYKDRQCEITISADDLAELLDGKCNAAKLFVAGKIKVGGDIGKALEFSKMINGKD